MQEEHQRKKITLKEIGIKNLCLLFGAGLVLVLASTMKIGSGKEDKKPTVNQVAVTEQTDALEQYTKELENRLTSILSRVEGVGRVEVMITLKSSKGRSRCAWRRLADRSRQGGGAARDP